MRHLCKYTLVALAASALLAGCKETPIPEDPRGEVGTEEPTLPEEPTEPSEPTQPAPTLILSSSNTWTPTNKPLEVTPNVVPANIDFANTYTAGYSVNSDFWQSGSKDALNKRIFNSDLFYEFYADWGYPDAININGGGSTGLIPFVDIDSYIEHNFREALSETRSLPIEQEIYREGIRDFFNTNFSAMESSADNCVIASVEYRYVRYIIRNGPFLTSTLKPEFIDSDFLANLYNHHPYDIVQQYGASVTERYSAGGYYKVIAVGESKNRIEADSRGAKAFRLIEILEASTKNNILGGDNAIDYSDEFKSIEFYLIQHGGAKSNFNRPNAVELSSAAIDFSEFDLSNENLYDIVPIDMESLPITDLIVEDNLRGIIESYGKDKEFVAEELKRPKLRLDYSTQISGSDTTLTIKGFLTTRYSTDALLSIQHISLNEGQGDEQTQSALRSEAERLQHYFNLEVWALECSENWSKEKAFFLFEEDLAIHKDGNYTYIASHIRKSLADTTPYVGTEIILSLHKPELIEAYGMENLIMEIENNVTDKPAVTHEYLFYEIRSAGYDVHAL